MKSLVYLIRALFCSNSTVSPIYLDYISKYSTNWLPLLHYSAIAALFFLFFEITMDFCYNYESTLLILNSKLLIYFSIFIPNILILITKVCFDLNNLRFFRFKTVNTVISTIFTSFLVIILLLKLDLVQKKNLIFKEDSLEIDIEVFIGTLIFFSFYLIFWVLIQNLNVKLFLLIIHNLTMIFFAVFMMKLTSFYVIKLIATLLLVSIFMVIYSVFREKQTYDCFFANKQSEIIQEDWKNILNDFPNGVILLSLKKHVIYINKSINDLFDFKNFDQMTSFDKKTPESDNKNEMKKEISINPHQLPSIPTKTHQSTSIPINHYQSTLIPINSHQPLSIEEGLYRNLVEKIGKIEEVNPFKESMEESLQNIREKTEPFSIMESSDFASNSINLTPQNKKKSILGFNPVNITTHSSPLKQLQYSQSFSKHISSDFLSLRKKSSEISPKNNGFLSNKENEKLKKKKDEFNETSPQKVDLSQTEYTLNDVINAMRKKIKHEKSSKKDFDACPLETLFRLKTYCTQYKNCKQKEKSKKKYELKIKLIVYKKETVFLIIVQDVSYLDLVQELRENNDYKTKVLTTLSHELRTPLNGAITPLEKMLKEQNLQIKDLEIFKEVDIAFKSMILLQSVLNDVVDYALINSNQLCLNYEEMNFSQFLRDTIHLFTQQAFEKNIELELIFDNNKKLPKLFKTDFQRLRQILVSLLNNAMKNTFEGSIKLHVNLIKPGYETQKTVNILNEKESTSELYIPPKILTKSLSEMSKKASKFKEKPFFDSFKLKKYTLKLSVEDTGMGIDEKKLKNIGKCLSSRDLLDVCLNLNRNTGCGVGLTISHCLSLLLGPQDNSGLAITSQLTKGTEVVFYLEAYVEKDAEDLSIIEENKQETSKYSTLRQNSGFNASRYSANHNVKTLNMMNSSELLNRKKEKNRSGVGSLNLPMEYPISEGEQDIDIESYYKQSSGNNVVSTSKSGRSVELKNIVT